MDEKQFLELKLLITGIVGRALTELEDVRIDAQVLAIIKDELRICRETVFAPKEPPKGLEQEVE